MAHLRDDIEAAKAAYEEDVKTQNVEIANLKDCLLEVQTYIFRFLEAIFQMIFVFLNIFLSFFLTGKTSF